MKIEPARIIWLLFVFLFFSLSKTFAQVLINEFSSGTTSDWVEIYNLGDSRDIATLKLVDGGGNQLNFPTCLLNKNGTYAISWSNKLNNDGDQVSLYEGTSLIDCVAYGLGPACEGRGIDLPVMGTSEFGARQPEGTGNWNKLTSSSKSDNSYCLIPTSTPVQISATPTPTSNSNPILPTATYKINEVKDKDGNILNSVKILVDGIYVHHYTPETIIFCDGCVCDSYVNCGFGEHLIELQKTGYKDWEEKKTFSSGNNFEVNPVMEVEEASQSSISTPTPSTMLGASPTPTKKITPTPIKIATISGAILGEEATVAAFFPLESTPTATITPVKPSGKNTWVAKIFLGLGMLALFGAAFSLWYTRLRN